MVKNLQKHLKKNSFLRLLKHLIVLALKKSWTFHMESPTTKKSVIYNDLAIQNIFFLSFILEP